MSFTTEQIAALDAKLDASAVATRTQAGRSLSYVEGWWVISEANRIFGFDGWARQTVELREVHEPYQNDKSNWVVGYMAKVRVTVGDIVREGCGFGSGIDRDLGRAHESALKEAETDSMKRALMTFGNPFGLALYDKTQENVEKAPPPARKRTDDSAAPQWGDPTHDPAARREQPMPVRVAPNGADVAAAKMVDQINMAVTVEALESTKALIRPDFLRLPREQQKHVASAAEAKALALEAA